MDYGTHQQTHMLWYMLDLLLQCTAQVVLHLRNLIQQERLLPVKTFLLTTPSVTTDRVTLEDLHMQLHLANLAQELRSHQACVHDGPPQEV